MFILDELYKEDKNYPITGSFCDRFLYYRGKDDDIDADVCIQNINMYYDTTPLISHDAEIRMQRDYNKSQKKYEIIDADYSYRGETIINCMQLLLQIVNYENTIERVTSSDIEKIKMCLKNSAILKKNPILEEKLETFVKKCYGKGNFFAIPFVDGYSLNRAKGVLKQSGNNYIFLDSSDTYFRVCYNYFVKGINACRLTKLIDEKYLNWKERYCGEKGWERFIEDNQFGGFVKNGIPFKMWNNTERGFAKDLESYLDLAIKALSGRCTEN